MRNVAIAFGALLGLAWIVIGAINGSAVAIVVGVILVALSASVVVAPAIQRRSRDHDRR